MRSINRIALVLFTILLLVIGGAASIWYQVTTPINELGAALTRNDSASKPTIGDLGGMPISIPPGIARFVEYQDDPGFMQPRKEPIPVRTLQSKFRSFGFEMRFPDKAVIHDETPEARRKINIYNTMWLNVGLDIKNYNDSRALNRQLEMFSTRKSTHYDEKLGRIVADGYHLLTEPLYGLRVYQVYGYDDAKRSQQPPNDVGDRNLYYHTNEKGEVDTYIQCDNTKHAAAPCNHYFVLLHAKNTIASANYRIGLLPQWQAIQAAATAVVLGFAVNPAEQNQNENRNAYLSSK